MLMMAVIFAAGCTKPDDPNDPNNGGNNGGGNSDIPDGHEFVDLGLPSGTLWATCNVGANAPEEYGDYFAWGETEPKGDYSWGTYKWCSGDYYNQLTKYCFDSDYGLNGFADNLTVLQSGDDAATVNWGEKWRMPDYGQWMELVANTTFSWTSQNGVVGCLLTSNNGKSLFLPAAGEWDDDCLDDVGESCIYWSNWSHYHTALAMNSCFGSEGYFEIANGDKCRGFSVRPVRTKDSGGSIGGNGSFNGHNYVDLGLPSGTLWATCNVGATVPESYGDGFAWGETEPKDHYEWDNYKYCNGSLDQLTKYCNNPEYGYNGFTDNLTTLQSDDDAATANWGDGWVTPSLYQLMELFQYTTQTAIGDGYAGGTLFTASNGNSLYFAGDIGIWSSSLDWGRGARPYMAIAGKREPYVTSFETMIFDTPENRCFGGRIRPVRSTE